MSKNLYFIDEKNNVFLLKKDVMHFTDEIFEASDGIFSFIVYYLGGDQKTIYLNNKETAQAIFDNFKKSLVEFGTN